MKKFLLVLCLALGLVGCAGKDLPTPQPETGLFRSGTSLKDVENILFDACSQAKWQIKEKGQNFMRINLDWRDCNFDAIIEYTNTRYSINFDRINRDKGKLKDSYAQYKKYALKLNRTIQKNTSLK